MIRFLKWLGMHGVKLWLSCLVISIWVLFAMLPLMCMFEAWIDTWSFWVGFLIVVWGSVSISYLGNCLRKVWRDNDDD